MSKDNRYAIACPTSIGVRITPESQKLLNEFAALFAEPGTRDLRVLVDPEATTDEDAMLLASRIGAKIEQELQFPGQIRVTVIREKRCVEYAR